MALQKHITSPKQNTSEIAPEEETVGVNFDPSWQLKGMNCGHPNLGEWYN